MTSQGAPAALAKVSAVTAVTASDDVLSATVVSNASSVLVFVSIPAVVGVPVLDDVPTVEHSFCNVVSTVLASLLLASPVPVVSCTAVSFLL
jgi:hypothetical protein